VLQIALSGLGHRRINLELGSLGILTLKTGKMTEAKKKYFKASRKKNRAKFP
jgi:hypothetical protein